MNFLFDFCPTLVYRGWTSGSKNNRPIFSRPTIHCAVMLLMSWFVLAMAGCNNQAEKSILEQGKLLVEKALQAWLDKQSPEDLKAQDPSITFFDDDWNRQAELLSFEFDEPFIEPSDGTARIVVFLKIREANGRQTDVRCAYQVVVTPEIVIARDPMS